MTDRYLDDFHVGDRFVLEPWTLGEDEIIAFAEEWDPQPFHTDPEAARHHEIPGLMASGLHSFAIVYRRFVESGLIRACSIAGPGLDKLRWLKPVRPGDTLRAELVVTEVRPSRSKPERGFLTFHYDTFNQRRENVLEFDLMHLVRRRPAAIDTA